MKPLRIWNLGLGGEGVKGLRGEGIKGLRIWNVELGIFKSGKRKAKSRRAFTLIELLGVMAIIGILAAVVLPPMISRIEDANTTKEDANLEEIARALVAGIKASGTIPNPDTNPTAAGGWVAMATNYSVLGTNELIRSIPSSTNDTVRRYFLSPSLSNFLANNYSPPVGGWPTNNFTNGPLFFLLVSVSKDGLLFGNGCRTNANMASNDVVFLQNWAKTNNTNGRVMVNNLNIVGTIAATSDRWTNRGQFLHVKVVDLRNLFCKVTLFDTASPIDASISTTTNGFTNNPIPSSTNLFGAQINHGYDSSSNATISSFFPPFNLTLPSSKFPRSNSITLTNYSITNGTSSATVTITAPAPPGFEIGGIATTNTSSQITIFYTLTGSGLRLISPVATNVFTIQRDSQFDYFGQNWKQSY
jgi:prepilin-type N-terminal cleavage/methylation domain-containing protein